MKNPVIKSSKSSIFDKDVENLQQIIQKTILSAQKYKLLDIFGANELNICITSLENIFVDLQSIKDSKKETGTHDSQIAEKLDNIKNELIIIFKNFGTESFKDLVSLLLGEEYINEYFINTHLLDRFNIIEQCVHPINLKTMSWKNETLNEENKKVLQKNRIVEDFMIIENAENLDCFDLARTSK